MKNFEAPTVDIKNFAVEDIITTSDILPNPTDFVPPTQGENQTPYG